MKFITKLFKIFKKKQKIEIEPTLKEKIDIAHEKGVRTTTRSILCSESSGPPPPDPPRRKEFLGGWLY